MLANIAGTLGALGALTVFFLTVYYAWLHPHRKMSTTGLVFSAFGLVGTPVFAAAFLIFMLWGL